MSHAIAFSNASFHDVPEGEFTVVDTTSVPAGNDTVFATLRVSGPPGVTWQCRLSSVLVETDSGPTLALTIDYSETALAQPTDVLVMMGGVHAATPREVGIECRPVDSVSSPAHYRVSNVQIVVHAVDTLQLER